MTFHKSARVVPAPKKNVKCYSQGVPQMELRYVTARATTAEVYVRARACASVSGSEVVCMAHPTGMRGESAWAASGCRDMDALGGGGCEGAPASCGRQDCAIDVGR